MPDILIASLLWVGTHLGFSSTGLRKMLVDAIGEKFYIIAYSLMATGTLGYLIWVYLEVPRYEYLWLPDPDLYWFAKLTMPIAFILMVGGFMVKNPTNVGMRIDDPAAAADMARGVTRITRHPLQWAIILWASGHVIANGDWVSVIFFTGFFVLSLAGSALMDHKKAATLGEGWVTYAQVTSNIPFVAIFAGRNRLVLKELIMPVIVGLLVYVLVYYFHESMTGALIV
jgi:uncharacterized membrane protein